MQFQASTPPRSTRRPIPLKARSDLMVERVQYQGNRDWVIKDSVSLKYYRLQPAQYCILRLLDGQRSLEQIRDALQHEYPTLRPSLSDIQHLIADLHHKGLAYSHRPGQGWALLTESRKRRRKKFLHAIKNVLYVRLPGWDPETTLSRLYPFMRWMFSPGAAAVAILLVLASWVLLAVRFDDFERALPEFHQFFSWPNMLYLWLIVGVAKIIHELSHGLACKHFGGECHEIGIAFLVLSPCLYCDVSDSWVLSNKWKRILIAAAGMCVEVVLSALALWGWWYSQPGLFNHLCLNAFLVTTFTTVIFNANPLLRYDGYYMLSDWLEVPNLRAKADKNLQTIFARSCLGIEIPPDPFMPERGRAWFVMYSVAAALYRWVILFSILFFLHQFLKPYGLQNLGIAMVLFSAVTIVTNLIYKVYKLITMPRNRPMSYPRIAATLSVVSITVAAAMFLPFPLHVDAPFYVEPHNVQNVFISTPGRLKAMYVRPGDRVKAGDLLAELTNFVWRDRYHKLKVRRDVQKIQVAVGRVLDHPAETELAIGTLKTVEEQLADYERQLDRLTIIAPCDGIVVAAPKLNEPRRETGPRLLSGWRGTPLDEKNIGCFLHSRTHLLSIAPDDQFQGILLVDQLDRDDVTEGQPVELKSDHRPGEVYFGTIAEISGRHLELAPAALSRKFGGELPTVTDVNHKERLTSIAYQATVLINRDVDLLKTGMRGQARFLVDTRTAGDWLWRYLRRTFHFRL